MKLSATLKFTLLAGAAFLSFSKAEAQKTYVKLGGGYNFGMGSAITYRSEENTFYTGNGGPTGTLKLERVNINHGKGAVFGAAFGHMFNNNLGLELGVNYLAGAKNEFENKETNYNSSFGQNSVHVYTENITTKSQMVFIQPSLVIASGLAKFNPYSRIGMVAAKGKLVETFAFSNSAGDNGETEDKLYGGWGFGLQAALGFDFNLNDKVSIYTEGTFNNLTYSPEKGEVTKYVRNGNDLLNRLTTSQREIVYKDEQTLNSNGGQPNSSEPSIGPTQRYTLNSVGINVGLKFSF